MPDDSHPSSLSPADNAAVTTHVNLLQGIINRLANNSASCKTWCLTLVSALVSLAGVMRMPAIVTFALVPVLIFGFVDTMYLAQEKAYRDRYRSTVTTIRSGLYERKDVYEASASVDFWHICSAATSWAILPVYGGLIGAYLLARCTGWLSVLATPVR